MATIEITKCDGCGKEVRGKEAISVGLWRGWLQVKVSGELRAGTSEISCSEALYHFCPECKKPLYEMLVMSSWQSA